VLQEGVAACNERIIDVEFACNARPEWKVSSGVLFGLSEAVWDFTYKFDIEVEF
jgi:hypothetical protein